MIDLKKLKVGDYVRRTEEHNLLKEGSVAEVIPSEYIGLTTTSDLGLVYPEKWEHVDNPHNLKEGEYYEYAGTFVKLLQLAPKYSKDGYLFVDYENGTIVEFENGSTEWTYQHSLGANRGEKKPVSNVKVGDKLVLRDGYDKSPSGMIGFGVGDVVEVLSLGNKDGFGRLKVRQADNDRSLIRGWIREGHGYTPYTERKGDEYAIGEQLRYNGGPVIGKRFFTEGNVYEVVALMGSGAIRVTTDEAKHNVDGFTLYKSEVSSFDRIGEQTNATEEALRAALKKASDLVAELTELVQQAKSGGAETATHTPFVKLRTLVESEAARDVEELEDRMKEFFGNPNSLKRVQRYGSLVAQYHVNEDKGTVVARLHGQWAGKDLDKGIAKLHPGDEFSESIGKAIALRRALGLPVPREYINAPR